MLNLARCDEPGHPDHEKLYFLNEKTRRKHWLSSPLAVTESTLLTQQIDSMTYKQLQSWSLGPPILYSISGREKISMHDEALYYLVQDIKGLGVEFGAATNPTALPLNCEVLYADPNMPTEGANIAYPGEHVRVDYQTSMELMDGIDDASLDFIIASHVIEHLPQTIKGLQLAHQKLKEGGQLVLAVPHKEHTFDRPRLLTPLEHFVADFHDYRRERDLPAIVESVEARWSEQARLSGIPYESIETHPIAPMLYQYLNGYKLDIHYHTFTEQSFDALLDWVNRNVVRWSNVEVLPHTIFDGAIEFFVRLLK